MKTLMKIPSRKTSQIAFQVCVIFGDISDQYWAQKVLLTEDLNQHAPLKERTIKEDQLLFMTSELRREMSKCNKLKNKALKDIVKMVGTQTTKK